MIGQSTHPRYFEKIYAENPDPWGYASSPYERDKYAATLAALPRPRFDRVFEIGCSIGVLTRLLAGRCGGLLAVDVSEKSLITARENCRGVPNVRFQRMRVPGEWPRRRFDLVILSEVLYYQSRSDERTTILKTLRSLRVGAVVVLVHWLGRTGTGRTGDEAAKQFIDAARPRLRVVTRKRNPRYRLDVLVR